MVSQYQDLGSSGLRFAHILNMWISPAVSFFFLLCVYLFTYAGLFFPYHHHHHHHQFLLSIRGHRASTKYCHLVLFLAILLTSLQLLRFSNASLWIVLCHICQGLPLLLFPCGSQSKASLSMASCPFLIVCPIQFFPYNIQLFLIIIIKLYVYNTFLVLVSLRLCTVHSATYLGNSFQVFFLSLYHCLPLISGHLILN